MGGKLDKESDDGTDMKDFEAADSVTNIQEMTKELTVGGIIRGLKKGLLEVLIWILIEGLKREA